MMKDPFTEALAAPDLFEKLAAIPQTRQHLADPGFQAQMKKLRGLATDPELEGAPFEKTAAVSQQIARAGQNDPRVMQALMALQGQGLIVDEKDLKRAEEQGDMQRREPVQLEQLALVKDLVDVEEAKARGNEYFKKGDLPAALAHYDKGMELCRSQEAVPAATVAALLSNATLCLLRLKWPDRAKKRASQAIAVIRQAEDESYDQSKLFYRRALACEQLRDFTGAVEDMARALQQAKRLNLAAAEQHRIKGEVDRLKKLQSSDDADKEKKRQQRENEKKAEVERMQGTAVSSKAAPAAAPDYLREQDFSFWAKKRLNEVVRDLTHTAESGAKIKLGNMNEEQSKVSAAITCKRGDRALYYDFDLHFAWQGTAAKKLRPTDGPGEMNGIIRVYNIGHDTSFKLGGDENTSYMYQLGWDHRVSGPWVEDLRTEAAELFDLIAAKVDEVIQELKTK
eukprot:TRINITY_DN27012_c0_g2_i1.p1 TRINITY_DN27012_c0_g2~~TRINITY_DN27012_c0_g2_i1.p1  ORF type:complete len:454 (+),score=133.70 TRINITY_DN27012_c0_g2_i1:231-1592(+)